MSWYENDELEHLGMIEFGFHSITEIEVYRATDGTLWFCDHDNPDDKLELKDVEDMVKDCNDPKYDEQVSEAEQMLGLKLR